MAKHKAELSDAGMEISSSRWLLTAILLRIFIFDLPGGPSGVVVADPRFDR
jgi:hypothetical protein